MPDFNIKECPKCKQRLRIPKNIGGVTLVCPTCGKKMASDFKLGQGHVASQAGLVHVFINLFELPGRTFDRLMKMISS